MNNKNNKKNSYIEIIKAVNNILLNYPSFKTKHELVVFCLKVAEEMTGSEFSFLGLVGKDGLLYEEAISNIGWKRDYRPWKGSAARCTGGHTLYYQALKGIGNSIRSYAANHNADIIFAAGIICSVYETGCNVVSILSGG